MSLGAWKWPPIARKAHYFLTGEIVSLCGGYMFSGAPTPTQDAAAENPGPDDCVGCWRKLQKQAAAPKVTLRNTTPKTNV
jgi:hypothetical protein